MNNLLNTSRNAGMCGAYLEPELYADLQGKKHGFETEQNAFIDDMIYMLDGPDRREHRRKRHGIHRETDVTAI